MRRRDLLIDAALLLGTPAALMAGGAGDEPALRDAIRAIYSVYFQERDGQRYRALLADDYRLVENGAITGVEDDIAAMPKPGDAYDRSDAFDFRFASVAGDSGHVVYYLDSQIRDRNGQASRRWLESAVFRRSGTRWLLVLLHSTRLSAPAPA